MGQCAKRAKVVLGVLPPAYRREHTVSRGFGKPQCYWLSVRCDGPGVERAARRLHCVPGSMEATSVRVAFVLGADCRKCDREDTTEARSFTAERCSTPQG